MFAAAYTPGVEWAIRDADAHDLPDINDVFRRSSLSNERDRELLLAHPEVLQLTAASLTAGWTRVAIHEGRIVGFATTLVQGHALELDALFVDPDRMRQGIATALVMDAVSIARDHGVDHIEVTGNEHAMGFYEASGFEAIGVVDTPLGVPAARLRRSVSP
jgi:GNAT superfamily N-acetyltransferase